MGDIIEMNVNEPNQSKVADERDKANFDKLNIVKRETPYNKVVDYIEFVRINSYDKNGMYHEYLMDYCEAVAIIVMYTDCDNYNFSFDDVMKFIQSDKWAKIKEELGDAYINFHYYVKKEIEYANTPLRFADDAMKKATESLEKINEILRAIDTEALRGYDFSKIVNAIDVIGAAKVEEQAKEQARNK